MAATVLHYFGWFLIHCAFFPLSKLLPYISSSFPLCIISVNPEFDQDLLLQAPTMPYNFMISSFVSRTRLQSQFVLAALFLTLSLLVLFNSVLSPLLCSFFPWQRLKTKLHGFQSFFSMAASFCFVLFCISYI